MTDCQNAEIRDQLPDFVHGQLSGTAHAAVAAHVASCVACASELALLRQLRRVLDATPTVDVARVVAALPTPARSGRAALDRSGSRRVAWRLAAAIVAIVIGGGSAAVVSLRSRDTPAGRPQVVQGIPGRTSTQEVAASSLSIDADLGEASVAELEALLAELETFDGLPAVEPDVLPLPSNSGEEGL